MQPLADLRSLYCRRLRPSLAAVTAPLLRTSEALRRGTASIRDVPTEAPSHVPLLGWLMNRQQCVAHAGTDSLPSTSVGAFGAAVVLLDSRESSRDAAPPWRAHRSTATTCCCCSALRPDSMQLLADPRLAGRRCDRWSALPLLSRPTRMRVLDSVSSPVACAAVAATHAAAWCASEPPAA